MTDPLPGRSSLPARVVTFFVLGIAWSLIWVNLPTALFSAWTGVGSESGVESRPSLFIAPDDPKGSENRHPRGEGPAVPAQETTGAPAVPRDQPALSLEPSPELNCVEEVRKLCGEVEPGSGRFRDCLQTYGSLLPPACRRRPVEMVARPHDGARAVLASCRADVRRFCPQTPMRGGPILRCLRTHAGDLSSACAEVLIRERVLD